MARGRSEGHVPEMRRIAHLLIRFYQLTLSAVVGRQCRHLPTCSAYMDDAIDRHGLWAGGWVGLARVCRCHPWGTDGFDPVPAHLPSPARWFLPWRYGWWRQDRLPRPDEAANPIQNGEDEVNAAFRHRSDGRG